MIRAFVLFLALFSCASAREFNAYNIIAFKHEQNALLFGTDKGELIRLDLQSKKPQLLWHLPDIQNHYEKRLKARIFSVDSLKNTFLLVSEGDFGSQNVSLCQNLALKAKANCATTKSPFANIKKAFLLDERTALFVLLSSEIKLVDLSGFASGQNSQNATQNSLNLAAQKEFQFSTTSLNDAALSEDRQNLLVASESGELQVFDTKAWRLLANYDKINKDTLDQVDFKGGVVLSCGKEKRIGIVRKGEQKFLQKDFLTYSCALSPSGDIAAFASFAANSQNALEFISTKDLKTLALLNEGDFFAKFIIFLDEQNYALISGKSVVFKSLSKGK